MRSGASPKSMTFRRSPIHLHGSAWPGCCGCSEYEYDSDQSVVKPNTPAPGGPMRPPPTPVLDLSSDAEWIEQ